MFVCVSAVCALVCASEEKQRKANTTKRVHLQTPQVVRGRERQREQEPKQMQKKKLKLLALSLPPALSLKAYILTLPVPAQKGRNFKVQRAGKLLTLTCVCKGGKGV